MEPGDRTNLITPLSAHRLPTISGSQALQNLQAPGKKYVTTGLPHLDENLVSSSVLALNTDSKHGGYPKGQITEIWGPPAAGKTSLALQASIEALRRGNHVVWIDAAGPLYSPRLSSILTSNNLSLDLLNHFHHYTAPTLPHLLSLIIHPSSSFPSAGTSLLIISNAATLFTSTYPSIPDTRSKNLSPDTQWRANRRYSVMAEFLSKLTRLATIHDLAVVLLSGTSIKVRSEIGRAMLRPMIWTKTWSDGCRNRIVVFRDFWHGDGEKRKGVRFVSVVKRDRIVRERLEGFVPFTIEQDGIREIESETGVAPVTAVPQLSPLKKTKRKRTEIADSQSEGSGDELAAPGIDIGEYDDEDLAGLDEGLDDNE